FSSKTAADRVKGMLSWLGRIGEIFGVSSLAVSNFTKSLQTLKSNDTILTEIGKTSEMAKPQLKELGEEAFKTASRYGQTSSGYLLGVQAMAKAGYGGNAKNMAELGTKAQSSGGLTAELSNGYIIATDKAFKMSGSVEILSEALDGANNITRNNALAMSDLAEAMGIVGAQAASSGLGVNETTAALSTMIAVTRESGGKMANAFKGILMNLQQVTGEVDGEEIGAESFAKYEKACEGLGVSLSVVKNGMVSLKEPMQVIKELSDAYTSLDQSDPRRKNLLDAAGNQYSADALNAILENYDMYEKMLRQYETGLGTMDAEAAKTASSWQGRLNALQNSWDSFVASLTDKEAVMNGVSFFDRLIQGSEKLVDTFGAVPVTLAAVNSAMAALHKDYGITQLRNAETGELDIQGNLFGIDFTAIKAQKKHFAEAEEAITGWNRNLKAGNANIESFNFELVENNAQLKDYLSTCSREAPASLAGYQSYLNAAGISTDALRLKTILLNAAVSMGVGIAIQAAVQGIAGLIHSQEKLRQETAEAADAYKESSASVEAYVSRYQELQQALSDAEGNETETYNIKKQLLDLQTELNDQFGDEYGKINLVTEAYEDQTKAIRAYNKEAAGKFLNENQEGIEDAEKAMTKKRQYNLGGFYHLGSNEAWEEAKGVAEQYSGKGIEIVNDYGDSFSFRLTADATSAESIINEFMTDLRNRAEELGNEHLFDGVLDVSSDSLNDAKSTISEYGDIYRQSLLADIARDDTKSGKFNELVGAVEEYNEAVLKSEDPYNDESVAQAREKLKALQGELSGEEWEEYRSVIQEVLGEADTKLLDFYHLLKNGLGGENPFKGFFERMGIEAPESLGEQAEKLKGLTRTGLEAMADDGDNGDVFDEFRKSAESYGLSVGELIGMLIRLGIVEDDLDNSSPELPKTLSEQFDQAKDSIDRYQSSIHTLSDAMADAGSLSSSDIAGLMQSHPDFDWDKYGVTGAAGVGELEDALQALVKDQMKEIDASLEAAGASDEMREAFASMAKEAVAGADRMGAVTAKLSGISSAYKTVQAALQEYAETGYMSADHVTSLLGLDDAYLAALVNEQGQVTLNADSYRLLAEARLAEAESAAISQAMADLSLISSNGEVSAKQYLIDHNYALADSNLALAGTYEQVAEAARQAVSAQGAGQYTIQAVNGVTDALNARMAIVKAGRESLAKSLSASLGGGGKSSGGGSSSASKPSSKEIDWFETRIKELEEAIELAQTHLDNLTGSKAKNHLADTLESMYSVKQSDLRQGIAM
ncbi:MAG: phage tail tape measure protein, partial [Lachnospiraceae bacterium]|nr:phage tail tape measure protein [Lachnospiraceae bacterium]